MSNRDRRLTRPEIDLIIYLLRVGAAATPVRLLGQVRAIATPLVRLEIVHIWHRQSVAGGRLDGPFYSLSHDGALRAQSLMLARQNRRSTPTYQELYADESTPPPPAL